MRPKKTVLLVCPNEVTASVLAYQLDVWGYRATKLHNFGAASRLLEMAEFELALLMPAADATKFGAFERCALEIDALQRARGARTQIYDSMHALPPDAALGVPRIPREVRCAEQLREVLRLVTVRKRGPRTVRGRVLGPVVQAEEAA